ncbi:MAG: TetR/AcrR family transcriptional regulator [Fidelibacterota bacterium]
MTRKFTDKEKKFYKQKMIDEATKLFSTLGFKKTSIDDITTAAGVAKGTFYNIFSSKEDILFAVLEEQEKFRDSLLDELMKSERSAESAIRRLVKQSLKETDENKIFKMFFQENLVERLYLKLSPERIEAHFAQDFKKSSEFIKFFQEQSDLVKENPEIIVGLLRGFFMLPLHKKEIGEDIYEDVMRLFTEVLAKGLTTNEVKND